MTFADQDLRLQNLRLLQEKKISFDEYVEMLGADDAGARGIVTQGNWPDVVSQGNYPNTVTQGNYPNVVTHGNWGDIESLRTEGSIPLPQMDSESE